MQEQDYNCGTAKRLGKHMKMRVVPCSVNIRRQNAATKSYEQSMTRSQNTETIFAPESFLISNIFKIHDVSHEVIMVDHLIIPIWQK